ncbi:MAG: hypothetical protein A3F68_04170 [Acidobacteria bacterium RIFCSPLOWO2_12_FULL_54_10]|nr:MAG: hypothetical protein A3F68_04170 [Acidobacteria bacterium RIFCSPLOWO2_12_FULL_54_10]
MQIPRLAALARNDIQKIKARDEESASFGFAQDRLSRLPKNRGVGSGEWERQETGEKQKQVPRQDRDDRAIRRLHRFRRWEG